MMSCTLYSSQKNMSNCFQFCFVISFGTMSVETVAISCANSQSNCFFYEDHDVDNFREFSSF